MSFFHIFNMAAIKFHDDEQRKTMHVVDRKFMLSDSVSELVFEKD